MAVNKPAGSYSGKPHTFPGVVLRTSEGWGFDKRPPDDQHADVRHKAGSVSFRNALLGLQMDQESFAEEEEEEDKDDDADENPSSPQGDTIGYQLQNRGNQHAFKIEHEAPSFGTEIRDLTVGENSCTPEEDGDSGSKNRCEGIAIPTKSVSGNTKPPRTTGLMPHPPNAPSPKPTRRQSRTRHSDSLKTSRKAAQAAAAPKLKLNLSIRETASEGEGDPSPLPKLRDSHRPFSHENLSHRQTGKFTAAPAASSPKLDRKKSLGHMSPVSARRRSVYDEPVGISSDHLNTQTRRLQVGPAAHASVPLPSTTKPAQPSLRRYSSVNLPPIGGPTRRRHSSVTPVQGSLATSAEPRHAGPVSSNILAHTFGGNGSGGAVSMARQRRVSQAVDELLHIEEVRRASEMRNMVASSQQGQFGRNSQSRDLGDMLQGLRDCRYLRGSVNEEEFV